MAGNEGLVPGEDWHSNRGAGYRGYRGRERYSRLERERERQRQRQKERERERFSTDEGNRRENRAAPGSFESDAR